MRKLRIPIRKLGMEVILEKCHKETPYNLENLMGNGVKSISESYIYYSATSNQFCFGYRGCYGNRYHIRTEIFPIEMCSSRQKDILNKVPQFTTGSI